jgi:hypothetical protein
LAREMKAPSPAPRRVPHTSTPAFTHKTSHDGQPASADGARTEEKHASPNTHPSCRPRSRTRFGSTNEVAFCRMTICLRMVRTGSQRRMNQTARARLL